ncbi:hypothetical protein PINS_up012638 [Pythium insidiosum]|nr:hypothetical protein PINS_up012638 [Pythium insidiosum]
MGWNYNAFLKEGAALVALSHAHAHARQEQEDSEYTAPWEWRHGRRPHVDGNAFLVSTANVRRVKTVSTQTSGLLLDISDEAALVDHEAEQDTQALPISSLDQGTVLLMDFHIVFHSIYQVPTLFFRAYHHDGSPAVIDLDSYFGVKSAMRVIAMDEHPVLGTPFHFLHPCETTSAMELLLMAAPSVSPRKANAASASDRSAPSYLLAWLSLVQSVTSINPLDYRQSRMATQ